jgi:hypothetical protein
MIRDNVSTIRLFRLIQGTLLAVASATFGCGASEGGPENARAHLTSELDKWVGGSPTTADTMEGRLHGTRPASYAIESLVRGEPHLLASLKEEDTPNDEFKAYPTYRANVTLTFKSMAGTPTNRIATYSVTWSEKRKKWYVLEVL